MATYSQSQVEHVYATEEVTYGVPVAAVAADAFKVINPGPAMKAEQAVIRGNEKTASRSQSPSLPCASISSTIAVPVYVEPSGTPGTPPDATCSTKTSWAQKLLLPARSDTNYAIRFRRRYRYSLTFSNCRRYRLGRYSIRVSSRSPTNYCNASSLESVWTF